MKEALPLNGKGKKFYYVSGHIIKIKTINLNQNWKEIHKNLLGFFN